MTSNRTKPGDSLFERSSRDVRELVVDVMRELVVDGCVMAMQGFTREQLADIAETSRPADGWLPVMIREYLEVWCETGERP